MARRRTAKGSLLPPVIFDKDRLPPSIFIEIDQDVGEIGIRNSLEFLQLFALDHGGAAWFYPQDDHTKCRFEWHRRWKRKERALRVGLFISVGYASNILQIFGYVADNRVFEDENFGPPNLTSLEIKRIHDSLNNTFFKSLHGVDCGEAKEFLIPNYIKGPFMNPTDSPVSFCGRKITLAPLRFFEGKMITPLIIKSQANRYEIAKVAANEDLYFLCAILSLYFGIPVDIEHHRWPEGFYPPKEISHLSQLHTLYPRGARGDHGEQTSLERLRDPVEWLISSFDRLDMSDREMFRNSLLAYWSGIRLRLSEPTLSSVPMFAALSAMSHEKAKKCQGTLTCSICGELPWNHNLTGDRQAITEFLIDLFSIPEDKRGDVNKLIDSLYREQRSSYVHAAKLRHQEHKGLQEFPLAMPTNDQPQSKEYQLNRNLHALCKITRLAIIKWLGRRSGHEPDQAQWNIPDWDLFPPHKIEGVVHTSRRWWTRLG